MFHESRPSLKCLNNTIGLLRQFCLGNRACNFQIESDQCQNFTGNCFAIINSQDSDINVSIPVFSIHGNHDDPAGDGNICPIDLLSSAGLVNYFGKASNPDDIQLAPILLRKGTSKLALYGLGNLRDERLHRSFLRGSVKLTRPTRTVTEWFNLFVLHQNRAEHGPKNYIPERFLCDFLDLVFWGHEHECIIDAQQSSDSTFFITQPGSSVATSLSEGESKSKHVGVLYVRDRTFELKKIQLKTVRPFFMQDVELLSIPELKNKVLDSKAVESYLARLIEEMLETINEQWCMENNHSGQQQTAPLPLIRLRVEYSGGFSTFNPSRFGLKFVNRVANPKDILFFFRAKRETRVKLDSDFISPKLPDRLDPTKVDDLIDEFLKVQDLSVLPGKKFTKALKHFVEKDDNSILPKYHQHSSILIRTFLITLYVNVDSSRILCTIPGRMQ